MPYGQNMEAEKYRPRNIDKNLPDIGLTKTEMEFLLEQRLREGLHYLKDQFSDFESYPLESRTGLSDLEYNIGPVKLRRERWPNLWDAVEHRDWATVAKESHRVTPNELRNIETKQLFLDAVRRESRKR
jgi:hypothetical protein